MDPGHWSPVRGDGHCLQSSFQWGRSTNREDAVDPPRTKITANCGVSFPKVCRKQELFCKRGRWRRHLLIAEGSTFGVLLELLEYEEVSLGILSRQCVRNGLKERELVPSNGV